jgi:hypothetical protein
LSYIFSSCYRKERGTSVAVVVQRDSFCNELGQLESDAEDADYFENEWRNNKGEQVYR